MRDMPLCRAPEYTPEHTLMALARHLLCSSSENPPSTEAAVTRSIRRRRCAHYADGRWCRAGSAFDRRGVDAGAVDARRVSECDHTLRSSLLTDPPDLIAFRKKEGHPGILPRC